LAGGDAHLARSTVRLTGKGGYCTAAISPIAFN
jgi:hypothetical protein